MKSLNTKDVKQEIKELQQKLKNTTQTKIKFFSPADHLTLRMQSQTLWDMSRSQTDWKIGIQESLRTSRCLETHYTWVKHERPWKTFLFFVLPILTSYVSHLATHRTAPKQSLPQRGVKGITPRGMYRVTVTQHQATRQKKRKQKIFSNSNRNHRTPSVHLNPPDLKGWLWINITTLRDTTQHKKLEDRDKKQEN